MALIDVLDASGNRTGRVAGIEEVTKKGLWRCGVHALVYNTHGDILVQKRSRRIIFDPDMLDVSFGGGVDAGEEPIEALVREAAEELGLRVKLGDVTFLGVSKYNHHWKTYGKIERTFRYNYLVCTDAEEGNLVVEASEVAWAKFLPLSTVKRLVSYGWSRPLGRLMPSYVYFRYLVRAFEIHQRL